MKGAKGKYTIITSKKAKKVDIAKIDISKENKIYFSYRHFSLFEYLTSQEFRKMFNESKTNYQKTLSLFIQNKLTDNDRNKTLLPAMRNSKISPQQKNFQKITNQSENKQKKFICVGGYSDIIKYAQEILLAPNLTEYLIGPGGLKQRLREAGNQNLARRVLAEEMDATVDALLEEYLKKGKGNLFVTFS